MAPTRSGPEIKTIHWTQVAQRSNFNAFHSPLVQQLLSWYFPRSVSLKYLFHFLHVLVFRYICMVWSLIPPKLWLESSSSGVSASSNILCCATEWRLFWHVMIKCQVISELAAKVNSIISIMVETSTQPLVGALYLIVFHIQAVIDSPDHCAWQLGLQAVSSQTWNSSQQRVLRSLRYPHFHATYTIWRC